MSIHICSMVKQARSCQSLKVRPDKIEAVKAAFEASSYQVQTELAKDAGCSRVTVSKFLNGKEISREYFTEIYEALETALHSKDVFTRNDIAMPGDADPKTWEGWATDSSVVAVQATSNPIESLEPIEPLGLDIDTLVQDVRQKVKDYIQERCGTMKVLDMSWPISLESIYTHVNILDRLTGQRRLNISELSQNVRPEDFDRLGYDFSTERMPGLEAVQQQKKLMVFGKPGAGKTTFLKYLAIQCMEKNFLEDCIPFFISLREFAETQNQPDLMGFMLQELTDISSDDLLLILQQGRLLLLLDGLDEVRAEDSHRIIREIETFTRNHSSNHIVATCRIASKEYTFGQFTDVEVADFDNRQIEQFAAKWFASEDSTKAKRFIAELRKNNRIKDLATNPLLLTLLCIIFEQKEELKANRAELYEEAIEILLKRWDASRDIKREPVYENLSINLKKALLSKIAFTFFAKGKYLFKKERLGNLIFDYIQTLSKDETGTDIEVSEIIKSIEAQHGLLVERAKTIYSFPHLTFHEYFTANQVFINSRNSQVPDQVFQELVIHLAERRWREVFLLTLEMLDSADSLLKAMKAEVDRILAGDEKLQKFLAWVQEKSESIEASYKPAAVRAFYFALDFALVRDFALDFALDPARAFVRDLARDFDLTHNLALDFDLTHNLVRDRVLDFALDRAFDRALYRARDLDCDCDLALARDRDLALALALARDLARTADQELEQSTIRLHHQLPDQKSDLGTRGEWWESNGETWAEDLRKIMISHRNIGHIWDFNTEQKEKLQQYYDANRFLVECLDSGCNVTPSVREEIKDTLLLPVAQIET